MPLREQVIPWLHPPLPSAAAWMTSTSARNTSFSA